MAGSLQTEELSLSDEEDCKLLVDADQKEEAQISQSQAVSSADAEFRRGLEELVRDHFDSCMALASSSDSSTIVRTSSFNQTLQEDAMLEQDMEFQLQCEAQDSNEHNIQARQQENGQRRSQILSRWYERRAEEVMTTMERQARQAELLALAGLHAVSMLDASFLRDSQAGRAQEQSSLVERPRERRRTSPLVQMWRGLEVDRRVERSSSSTGRMMNSGEGNTRRRAEAQPQEEIAETAFQGGEIRPSAAEERIEIGETARESVRQIMDRWMTERVASNQDSGRSQRERNELLDLNERERVRELAREWLRSNSETRADSEAEAAAEDWEAQRRRDRQLILDLLMRTERERQQELEGLSEHRVVSGFPHRGRLQSLLRGRFLGLNRITREEAQEQEEEEEEDDYVSSSARELRQLRQRRAVSDLREGFRSRLETIVRSQASSSSDNSRDEDSEARTSEDNWSPTRRMNPLEDAAGHNVELRELLGRRSVTNILASEFRERLDHLIRSFIHRQVPWPVPHQNEAQPSQQGEAPAVAEEINPAVNTARAVPLAPPPPPPPPTQATWQPDFVQGQWPRPSLRNPYMVWDNASQMRSDISRLQQGLGDLQRLVETCVDMQLELQRSIRQEVAGAMQRMYDAGKGFPQAADDGSQWTPVRKGTCFICCDKSIDSLLYRCGHMCTCLKCAYQLMQTGSKCPMCRAAIVEVIRAFTIA